MQEKKQILLLIPLLAILFLVVAFTQPSSKLSLNPQHQTAQALSFDTNLISHYTFDETSGTTAGDSAGSNNGTLIGGPTWSTGNIDGALSFDGTNYVNIPDNSTLEGFSSMTVATWINSNTAQSGSNRFAVGKGASYVLTFDHAVTNFQGHFAVYDGTTWYTSGTSENTVASNTWVHFVGVYDGTNLKVYENGTESSSRNVGSFTIASNPNDLGIGANGSGGDKFSGVIDDVRIYNRALSASEITELYNYSGETTPTSDTTPPSTPTNLQTTTISPNQINLSWSASTDNTVVTGYNIYRNGSILTTTTNTTYQNIGLSPSTTYSYTVSAYDQANNTSAQSLQSSATTQATTPSAQGTYYVATIENGGNDNNPGTNSLPFRTIQHAANIAQPGNTVHVKAGTYYERISMINSGTPRNPIVFEGGERTK